MDVDIFEAPWEAFKQNPNRSVKEAGFYRNQKMVEASEALVAIWDGSSNGTKDTIDRAIGAGLTTFVLQP